jgi:DNA-binding XRE family transcriptional regulator
MRASKRKKLTGAGWEVGDATDFLGLSPEEEAYIELRLKLADGLKARRSRKKLTQVELAKSLGSSQSRVAKMEAGDPTVSVDLLVRSRSYCAWCRQSGHCQDHRSTLGKQT